MQFVRRCYGLRGIYGQFDLKIRFEIESDGRLEIRFERKKTINRSLLATLHKCEFLRAKSHEITTREVQLLLTGWWRRRPRPTHRAPAWTGGVCSSTLRGTCTDRRACCHSESWPQSLPLGRDWVEPVGLQSVATLPCHQYNSSLLDTCIRSSFNYHLTRFDHCFYHGALSIMYTVRWKTGPLTTTTLPKYYNLFSVHNSTLCYHE